MDLQDPIGIGELFLDIALRTSEFKSYSVVVKPKSKCKEHTSDTNNKEAQITSHVEHRLPV